MELRGHKNVVLNHNCSSLCEREYCFRPLERTKCASAPNTTPARFAACSHPHRSTDAVGDDCAALMRGPPIPADSEPHIVKYRGRTVVKCSEDNPPDGRTCSTVVQFLRGLNRRKRSNFVGNAAEGQEVVVTAARGSVSCKPIPAQNAPLPSGLRISLLHVSWLLPRTVDLLSRGLLRLGLHVLCRLPQWQTSRRTCALLRGGYGPGQPRSPSSLTCLRCAPCLIGCSLVGKDAHPHLHVLLADGKPFRCAISRGTGGPSVPLRVHDRPDAAGPAGSAPRGRARRKVNLSECTTDASSTHVSLDVSAHYRAARGSLPSNPTNRAQPSPRPAAATTTPAAEEIATPAPPRAINEQDRTFYSEYRKLHETLARYERQWLEPQLEEPGPVPTRIASVDRGDGLWYTCCQVSSHVVVFVGLVDY